MKWVLVTLLLLTACVQSGPVEFDARITETYEDGGGGNFHVGFSQGGYFMFDGVRHKVQTWGFTVNKCENFPSDYNCTATQVTSGFRVENGDMIHIVGEYNADTTELIIESVTNST